MLLLSSGYTSAKQINWYISDFFPCHIFAGPKENKGYCDYILRHITQAMHEYQHNVERVVLSKLISAPDKGEPFCTLQLLKTQQRQLRFTFGEYFLKVQHNGIYIRADDTRFAPYMTGENTVSLEKLVQDPKLILARDSSRAYGRVIDELLTQAGTDLPQVKLASDTRYADLLKNRRIDYTIAYATELYDSETGFPRHYLKFLSIAEPQEQEYAYASCSKAVSPAVLASINKVVVRYRDNVFVDYYQQWLPEYMRQ